VNLPAANKFDPPAFQNAKASALPLVTLCEEPRVTGKVLVGALRGMASPVVSDKVRFEYIDFELAAGGALAHAWDEALTTKFLYVYRGAPRVGAAREEATAGELLCLGPGNSLSVDAGAEPAGMLFIAGGPRLGARLRVR
jgi:redox-sensitive bicupin YhaK (pirin superfamily)